MKRPFNDEDIIRFLFDEMEQTESEQFLDAICADEDLWDRSEYFQSVVEELSGLTYEPSEYSCQTILNYVRETAPSVAGEMQHDLSPSPDHPGRFWSKLPIAIGANAIVAIALLFFFTVGAASLAYRLQRGTIEPDMGEVVQQVPKSQPDPRLDWEDEAIHEELQLIRNEIESLQAEPTL